jgi:hypothetical protein
MTLALVYHGCYSVCRMHPSTRWTAGILSLVMAASVFAPIALAQSMQSGGMHCLRPSLRRKNVASDQAPCHGAMKNGSMANAGMAEGAMAEDSLSGATSKEADEPSWRSSAECCGNHDCCCRMGSSARDRALPTPLSTVGFVFERTSPSHAFLRDLRVVVELDSARAPPV